MKKLSSILILVILLFLCQYSYAWPKKQEPALYITAVNPFEDKNYDTQIVSHSVFKINSRIYFLIYNPKGFKSDYIKYQIVKQDDKAFVGGYTRIRNKTVRLKNKNYYCDYFVLSETGKYFLQVFDITDLNTELAVGAFRVVDE